MQKNEKERLQPSKAVENKSLSVLKKYRYPSNLTPNNLESQAAERQQPSKAAENKSQYVLKKKLITLKSDTLTSRIKSR